jgi:hypothetical protein
LSGTVLCLRQREHAAPRDRYNGAKKNQAHKK